MYSHGMTGQSSSRGTCVRPNTYLRDGGHEQCHTMTGEHYSAPHCMQQVHVMSHPALPCPALPRRTASSPKAAIADSDLTYVLGIVGTASLAALHV